MLKPKGYFLDVLFLILFSIFKMHRIIFWNHTASKCNWSNYVVGFLTLIIKTDGIYEIDVMSECTFIMTAVTKLLRNRRKKVAWRMIIPKKKVWRNWSYKLLPLLSIVTISIWGRDWGEDQGQRLFFWECGDGIVKYGRWTPLCGVGDSQSPVKIFLFM